MLTHDRTTQTIRPKSELGSRWWLVTGLTGLAVVTVGGFAAFVLAWDLDPTWVTDVITWIPLALDGLITGYVGGVRRWWLLVPTVVAPLVSYGLVVGEGELYPYISGLPYWLVVTGGTTLVTVFVAWLIRRFAG